MVNSKRQITEFLKTMTSKQTVYGIGLAWGKVSPTSIENCWSKCVGQEVTDATDSVTEIAIPECSRAIASIMLETSLQDDDFEDWVTAD